MSSPIRKLTWAFNVFDETAQHSQVLQFLNLLDRAIGIEVQPVFIMGPATALPHEPFFDFQKEVKDQAVAEFEKLRSDLVLSQLNPLEIVVTDQASTRGVVDHLLKSVEKFDSDTILVSSHARKGLAHFFLGSFAETLMLRSTFPLVVVNPHSKMRERISKVLFPSDFDEKSFSSFMKTVQFVKGLGGELTVFYKEPFLDDAYLSPKVVEYVQESVVRRRKVAEEWKKKAADVGLQVKFDLDVNPGHLTSSIESKLKAENFDLVVMTTQADPLSNFFLGSVTRQVLRESSCPVWVLRGDE